MPTAFDTSLHVVSNNWPAFRPLGPTDGIIHMAWTVASKDTSLEVASGVLLGNLGIRKMRRFDEACGFILLVVKDVILIYCLV